MPEARITTLDDLIDLQKKFPRGVLNSVREFRRSKPWQGDDAERRVKLQQFNTALAAALGVAEPTLVFAMTEQARPNGIAGIDRLGRIVLAYKLSVVSYLEVFAVYCGRKPRAAQKWAANLFRRCFPRSYARCRLTNDGFLVSRS